MSTHLNTQHTQTRQEQPDTYPLTRPLLPRRPSAHHSVRSLEPFLPHCVDVGVGIGPFEQGERAPTASRNLGLFVFLHHSLVKRAV